MKIKDVKDFIDFIDELSSNPELTKRIAFGLTLCSIALYSYAELNQIRMVNS